MGNQLEKSDSLQSALPLHIQPDAITESSQAALKRRVRAAVPWLDAKTATLVAAIIAVVAAKHPEVEAAILFGSLARHEERPLDDPSPSDVDLLLLVRPDPARQRLPYAQQLALWESIGNMQYRYRDAPREVEVTLTESTLADWDEMFVTNVAHDGIYLWTRSV